MVLELAQNRDFLKSLYLFQDLTDAQIGQIASWFTVIDLEEGQRLFSAGDPPDSFYIILKGQVIARHDFAGGETTRDILIAGDFFGEDALLYNRPRSFSITALEATRLLRLDSFNFFRLTREHPRVRSFLGSTAESRLIADRQHFRWLKADEVVYLVRRKHEVVLILSLILPFLASLISLSIIFFVSNPELSPNVWRIGLFSSAFLFFIALIWGAWNWIDWGNDYYIITDQRAVWVEKVIWLYDSRTEAPLVTILSVSVTTSQVGRILNYGNVIIRTFTGQIVFRNVGQPYQMAAMIEEYWHRSQRLSKLSEQQDKVRAVDRIFEKEETEEVQKRPSPLPPPPSPPELREPSSWQKYFANIFKMRFEEGNVITYRKFWTALLSKTLIPTSLIILVLIAMGGLIIAYGADRIESPSPWTVLMIGFPTLLFILLPWWGYHYVDWRNDIYQVTDKNIFDIERRPLGTEVRKSAPLENVLSLEHERVGFLGYLLNFGNVTVNVGETKFVFLSVQNPAEVQQDVFNRMYALRQQKQAAEIIRERDQMVQLLEIYHRKRELLDEDEDSDEFGL